MALTPFFGRNNRNSIWDPLSPFSSSIFDPSEPFSVFDRPFFGRGFGGGMVGNRVDWVETPEAHVFKADIPGMKKDEVKVEVVDGRTLSISGERKEEKFEEKDTWRRLERSYGKFSRQFGLPENANVAEVGAKVENGVLTVIIPKLQVRAINIQ